MQNDKIFLPLEIYSKHLETIKGIRFTLREVDIIACILNGRSARTISSFLSISTITFAAHIDNIRAKASCSSRESIIDFVENSDKFSILKNDYYLSLLTETSFKKRLQAISKEGHSRSPVISLIYEQEQ